MTQFVWLRPSEEPPDDCCWALVAVHPEGWRGGGEPVAHRNGVTFYIPDLASEAERSEAIARALVWAQRHEVQAIYMQQG